MKHKITTINKIYDNMLNNETYSFFCIDPKSHIYLYEKGRIYLSGNDPIVFISVHEKKFPIIGDKTYKMYTYCVYFSIKHNGFIPFCF